MSSPKNVCILGFELSANTDNWKIYERMFGFLLTNAKRRAIIPTQLNKNSIRASGGNLNRLDYQAPCESKWWWDNCIILNSNERRTVNGWTTERRASQNDTGWLYHFGSTAFFDARIARTTKEVFSSWSGKDFFFCLKFFGTLEQFHFLALFFIRERKIEWPSERDTTLPWRRKAEQGDAAVRLRGRNGVRVKRQNTYLITAPTFTIQDTAPTFSETVINMNTAPT